MILILDEPTSSLDEEVLGKLITEFITEYSKMHCVIMITHNLAQITKTVLPTKSMKLKEIVLETCDRILHDLKDKSFYFQENNGPYKETETPIRSNAHICQLLAYAYKLTKEPKYELAVLKLVKYLTQNNQYLGEYNFIHRHTATKDTCNGVIGIAWVVELFFMLLNILN